MKNLLDSALQCCECPLSATRNHIVFGSGSWDAQIVCVGEAPGSDENLSGIPFCGKSGMLLRETLFLAGLDPDKIFICNTLMCQPPDNRNPLPEELIACDHWLREKIDIISPKMIITAGKFSTAAMLGQSPAEIKITKLSGKRLDSMYLGIPLFPIVHPSYVLRGGLSKVEYLLHMATASGYAEANHLRGIIQ